MTESWLARVSDEEGMLEKSWKTKAVVENRKTSCEWGSRNGEDLVLMIQAQRTFRNCQGRLAAMELSPSASFGAEDMYWARNDWRSLV